MNRTGKAPGFRFSATDGVVLVACAIATAVAWRVIGSLALLFTIVLVHFFLFCNVFRVRRRYELFWAGTFVVNVLGWSLFGQLEWWRVLMAQTPITLTLIGLEIASERYHGVGYRWKRRPVLGAHP